MNKEPLLAAVSTKKEGLAELTGYLKQIQSNSTSSFIGKAAFRGRELGVSKSATISLLTEFFRGLGYDDFRPLRIAHFVKGCYRWAKDREGDINANN